MFVAVKVAVGGTGVSVAVDVLVAVKVADGGTGVSVAVDVLVAVKVADGGTGVTVAVDVLVAVNVAVSVGMEVAVGGTGVSVAVDVLVAVKVAVCVGVDVNVSVGVGGRAPSYSNAPMSHAAPCGRLTPRWSVEAQGLLTPPVSRAELPAPMGRVWVKPPLFASAPRSGSVVTMLVPAAPPCTTLSEMLMEPVPSVTISLEPSPHRMLLWTWGLLF